MHNIKEAIYENKRKLEGIGEDYQIQVSAFFSDSNQKCLLKRSHVVLHMTLDFQLPLLLNLCAAK